MFVLLSMSVLRFKVRVQPPSATCGPLAARHERPVELSALKANGIALCILAECAKVNLNAGAIRERHNPSRAAGFHLHAFGRNHFLLLPSAFSRTTREKPCR